MGYLRTNRNVTTVIPRKPDLCRAKPVFEILDSNSWKGQRCFIICGGPSLQQGFRFNSIREEKTIGINKSFMQYDTTITYAMDQRFYDMITYPNRFDTKNVHLHNCWKKYKGIKVILRESNKQVFDESVFYVNHTHKKLISRSLVQGIYPGGNSGFGGMMLAIALGCTQIYLLGCDMKIDEKQKKTHWHDGYPNQRAESVAKSLEGFKKEFEEFAFGIQERGIQVINLNMDSALECFPKQDFRKIL